MDSARRKLGAVAVAVGCLVAVGRSSAQDPAPAAEGPTAVRILRAMEKAYAGCRSYRDTGEVRTAIVTEGGRAGSSRPFATAFVRPGRFRFTFTDPGLGERSSSYIAWSDGTDVRSWWDAKPGVRDPGSLEGALVPAAGISGGSSVRVPGLLMPDALGQGPLLIAPERIADATDGGAGCFRVRGKGRTTPYTLSMGGRVLTVRDETVTVWVDRASFLIRKVEETRTFETYTSESTTTYAPETDVEIPDGQLAFGAPAAPAR